MKTCPLGSEFPCCRTPGEATSGSLWMVHLEPGQLLSAVRRMDQLGYFIEDVCGLDVAEGFEVVYHFDHFEQPGRVSLRVLVPHHAPEVPSIAGIFSGADWHERETNDFVGVVFTGHPNLAPLLVPAELEEGDPALYPLRRAEAERVSVHKLFPIYDMVDCRPDFLTAAEGGEGEAS